ncbi:glucose-6-phosphate dehydrogenase assembly protein OpcA [Rhodococcus sp. C26F]|uniref:glucose-6-phosphate dehydrogenase assembly protein OpcA n=1 Tax=Rhodococcus sp. AB351 TaxID=3413280 RepID=UPI000363F105|nr:MULTISPECIES: glucose-6-phosphate dehydrogenase assembly protein OpcA [Rhodococcus]
MEASVRLQLRNTSANAISRKLVELRRSSGMVTQGRVLTFIVCAGDARGLDAAITAATEASKEHPCRVIVVGRGRQDGPSRLDAEIRVAGEAGASEALILALHGELGEHQESVVVPFLLPDTPVVAWWPNQAPAVPAEDPVGRLAVRRITDVTNSDDPRADLATRLSGYRPGDTDLAWARITYWRALLVSALDQPPYEPVLSARVSGLRTEPAVDLIAGWLASRLDCPVERAIGELRVELRTASQTIALERPQEGRVATLERTHKPDSLISLARRNSAECLAEELRRLDPDEVYEAALSALPKVDYV